MGRWEPNAQNRLAEAAMELYSERGFDQTTVAQIAERAGLTERTFFRYFTDKREVLFGNGDEFKATFLVPIANAPADASPMEVMALSLDGACNFFDAEMHEFASQRRALLLANNELMERELIKLASLKTSIAHALVERRTNELTANLTAEIGIGVFHVAFQQWLDSPKGQDLRPFMAQALTGLREVATS